jgi:prolipoprotein diacylglyceryltransferase
MNLVFLLIITLVCAGGLSWGFVILPRENFQFIASVPLTRDPNGHWRALNLTWYGVLTAASVTCASFMFLVLCGAAGLDHTLLVVVGLGILSAALPASRLVARLVEGKLHTFTIGGAVFVAFALSPALVALANHTVGRWVGHELPLLPVLGAAAIAYAFGEGLGRLACVSFGCCYGKPVSSLPSVLRPLFHRFHFVFRGSTRKIAYASGLEGEKVIPIQAMTALAHCSLGVAASALFLAGHFRLGFALALAGTQTVRVLSEFLRDDHRGGRFGLTTYQWMALALALFALGLGLVSPPLGEALPSLTAGLALVWTPGALVGLLSVLIAVFLFTGRSEVTTATVDFSVRSERI